MTLLYITLDQDDKYRAHKFPPTGKTALIVNTTSDLKGAATITVAHDLESYDVFVGTQAGEVITWAAARSAVNINRVELVV